MGLPLNKNNLPASYMNNGKPLNDANGCCCPDVLCGGTRWCNHYVFTFNIWYGGEWVTDVADYYFNVGVLEFTDEPPFEGLDNYGTTPMNCNFLQLLANEFIFNSIPPDLPDFVQTDPTKWTCEDGISTVVSITSDHCPWTPGDPFFP